MEASEAAEVEEGLNFAVAVGEDEALAADEVEGAGWGEGYDWMRARGNSTTPPRKSVKFW